MVPSEGQNKFLFLSGGSGITPLMSISRAFGDAHQFPDIVFLHAGRTPQDFIFNDELAFRAKTVRNFRVIFLSESIGSKPEFMGGRGKDIGGVSCRRRPGHCRAFYHVLRTHAIHGGGAGHNPRSGCSSGTVSRGEFRRGPLVDDAVVADGATETAVPTFKVTFAKQARTIDVAADQSVLAAAKKAGVRLPSSCANGICGTCKSKLVSGKVDMQHGGGIHQREIDAGQFLPCCSKPLSDLIVER